MSRSIPKVRKDPNAKKDWLVDWTLFLQSGEEIATSSWVIDTNPDALEPTTLVISIAPFEPSKTTTTTTVWLEAGTVNKVYRVRNRITTSDGRIDDQSMDVVIEHM
jgi:hypothetical protein